ncbi:hypothetical protein I6A84_13200 [Frankia sp. CNm7]|uniref:DUF2567 domain-containing protein n=1 Tax=Frankia nepalensis TaxID=1836974 RepID=A0A937RH23_9ACTN|nr:hypothetical protein [Frankia nepalensis]MBL7500380.1 hypothetical protein [Frankia nepalensis]MBL7508678.1 hypothetical protein [Frankia nepalensis]MBL7519035.1 hypothetical protein [Frankia nepalensis]MBL7628840.1 hypothetical protein [Frankia nepalensis]
MTGALGPTVPGGQDGDGDGDQDELDDPGGPGGDGFGGHAGPGGTATDARGHRAHRRLPVFLGHLDPGLRAGLVCLLGLTLAGPLLGLLWAAVSPRLDLTAAISGSETAFAAQGDIDATFGFICLGAGVVAGLLARWRAADAGWPVPVALGLGGGAGSLIAGAVGHAIRSPDVLDKLPDGANDYVIDLVDMKVRAPGLYLVLPVVALLVLALTLWLPAPWPPRRRASRTPPEEQEPDAVFATASAFRPVAHLPMSTALDDPAVTVNPSGPPVAGATPNGASPHGSTNASANGSGSDGAGPDDPASSGAPGPPGEHGRRMPG